MQAIQTNSHMSASLTMNALQIGSRNPEAKKALSPNLFADTVANERLLEKCRMGDREAVDSLLSRFEGFINRLAYQLSGNYDDAGDVASEAYVRLSTMLGSCRSAAALPSWVRRVVSNAACDLRRKTSRCPTVSLEAVMEASGDACLSDASSQSPSPQSQVELQERSQILEKAISTLPGNQQMIIRLFYLQELSHDEIASNLGVKVGTVKSRLNRARESLLNRLSGQRALLTQ